jgi:aminoglycoside phosphotransferase (APT) family kinase protein
MEKIVKDILAFTLNKKADTVLKIQDLGSVNDVYDVRCNEFNYIVRINQEINKEVEFIKEKWCLEKATELGIPSPPILKNGIRGGFPFMIQNKIEGINGSQSTAPQHLLIWKDLGQFARQFHQIKRIEVPQVEANEFHPDWKSRLEYNINQIEQNDSLLENAVFNELEQEKVVNILEQLRSKSFIEGLVHGDLCPRNTIFKHPLTTLLDWGTAGINVVPHTEIGIILMESKPTEDEFNAFLEGLNIQQKAYKKIEGEIKSLNLLHQLDKYRWACEYDFENIKDYIIKIRVAYEAIINPKES